MESKETSNMSNRAIGSSYKSVKICVVIFLAIGTAFYSPRALHKYKFSKTRVDRMQVMTAIELIPHDVVFLKTPSFKQRQSLSCMKNKKIHWTMVIFVKSKIQNYEQRRLIRQSWGSVIYANGALLHTVFIVGIPESNNLKSEYSLEVEDRTHADILQVDIPDTYQNLARKSLAAMHWASGNLPAECLFTNSDDDMLLDLKRMIDFVNKFRKFSNLNWPEFPIICMYHKETENLVPNRFNTTKRFVSKDKYKWPVFPQFCLGGMYTMSTKVAGDLWHLAITSESFETVEDVWITGLLRQNLGMPKEMLIGARPAAAIHFEEVQRKDMLKYVYSWDRNLKKLKSKYMGRDASLCLHH